VRRRKPYTSRHSYISWRLMAGHNRLLVAQEDGHSVEVMERTYAAWIKGAKSTDVKKIKAALAGRPSGHDHSFDSTRFHRRRYSNKPLQSPGPHAAGGSQISKSLSGSGKAAQIGGRRVGWGGRIRTYEWRDQNPLRS
jgi:hypothetical protein